ncbi:LLM class flavin-dependent oxidoreductase [Microbacterium mcarthurae (nom. nud.)]|jgi:alkanesulfonate monooxygenase SsuD/methylene tetrahydromethanopterin reductase-like flavin-dependent oxidoreductase (luciferase family)|uniref:LLM class flavin-dependent oxidoreductase n=1 Tax=Microbacterium mcarthurae TaxID=3035918 RepID=A0ABW9GIG6_9MICO
MRFSIMLPFVPRRFSSVYDFARLVDSGEGSRLWQGQATVTEPHQIFTELAGAGMRLSVGTGVTLMPLRHPFEAALQARSVAIATGRRMIAGFGPGAKSFQRSLRGSAYDSPLTAAAEYVQIVTALLRGGEVHTDGDYFSMHGALPSIQTAGVDVGLGVLRPGMARVAGRHADAAITWLTPPDYLRDVVVPALDDGTQGRRRRPHVVAMVPVGVRRAHHEVGHGARLALAGSAAHLSLPHYRDMLRRAGIAVTGTDAAGDARRLVEGNAFLYGDAEEILTATRAYADAGVDEIVLNTTGVLTVDGPRAALADLREILACARTLTPV